MPGSLVIAPIYHAQLITVAVGHALDFRRHIAQIDERRTGMPLAETAERQIVASEHGHDFTIFHKRTLDTAAERLDIDISHKTHHRESAAERAVDTQP